LGLFGAPRIIKIRDNEVGHGAGILYWFRITNFTLIGPYKNITDAGLSRLSDHY